MAAEPTEGKAEITKQLERAKAALAVSRAKLEAQEQAEAGLIDDVNKEKSNGKDVPFFAMNSVDDNEKKEKVIKDKNEDGLFTTGCDVQSVRQCSGIWPFCFIIKEGRQTGDVNDVE